MKNEDIGSFVTIESRCTCFAANASAQDKEAALDILLDRFYNGYTAEPRKCMSTLADELSYISAGTYRSLSLNETQPCTGQSLEQEETHELP